MDGSTVARRESDAKMANILPNGLADNLPGSSLRNLPNIVVVGAQWGDEAKGKIIDVLACNRSMVVRYGGGNNAGHSVTVGDIVYKFHLIPSGVLYEKVVCVIADGVVIDPGVLISEMKGLEARGISMRNLKLSGNAHLILPYHRTLDLLEEERRGESKIGTTGRGIGPAYTDKAARIGIRVGDLLDKNRFEERLRDVLTWKNEVLTKLYGAEPLDADAILLEYRGYADYLRPYVTDTGALVSEAVQKGNGVLFEGAQGTLLDLDQGTYPYVTSSHPIAGGACIGTGIGPGAIDRVIGVAKSYTTRVGAGCFPTEQLNETGHYIRERGHEYGTTTGRPRRCGWLDALILRYAVQVNGLDYLSLGHLDVLAGLDEVKICVGYHTLTGETLTRLPSDLPFRTDLTPVYETLPGWGVEAEHARTFEELPQNAQAFVRRVEELAGVTIASASVGPGREQTIFIEPHWSKLTG